MVVFERGTYPSASGMKSGRGILSCIFEDHRHNCKERGGELHAQGACQSIGVGETPCPPSIRTMGFMPTCRKTFHLAKMAGV